MKDKMKVMTAKEEFDFFDKIKRDQYAICNQNIRSWKETENETIDLLFTKNPLKTIENLDKQKESLSSSIKILKSIRGRQKYNLKEVEKLEDEKREYFIERYIDLVKEIYRQIEIKKKENPLPQRLQTNLRTDQRAILFTKLVNGGFIPSKNEDCFNYAIGVINETQPKPPGQWQSIEWNKSKEDFVRLFHPILREISGNEKTISREHKGIIKILFWYKDIEPMNDLRNPPPKQNSEIEDILTEIGIITEQPFKHNPIR
jgi:hypothetical protein